MSRNELIARIDQDDLWVEGKLDLQCAALEADQDLAMSFTGMEWTDENGRPIAAYDRGMSWPEAIDFCQHIGCPIPHPSIVVRRDIILALGGYPESPLSYACEDFLLWATLIRFFKAEGLSDCLLKYRQHPASISSSRRESQAAATSRIMADLKRLGNSIDYVDAFVTSALSLGKTRFEFGLYLLEVWRFGGELTVPTGCVERIRSIFYDRCVNVIERGLNHALVAVSRL